jgi:hypothetical protein
MLFTGMLLMLANMSIEPIITVYVATLVEDPNRVTMMAGLVMSAAALGSILSASRLGKLADRVGHWNVIVGCLAVSAVLLIPQAFVTSGWQLVVLRFLMGLSLGGLLPCIASVIRHNVPERVAGNMLGYSTSAQYTGQVAGPLLGGFVGGHIGMRAVFLGTCVLMAAGAGWNWLARGGPRPPRPPRRQPYSPDDGAAVGRVGLDVRFRERHLEPLALAVGARVVAVVRGGRIVRQREREEGMRLHAAFGEAHDLHVAVAVRVAVHRVAALVEPVLRARDGEVARSAAAAVQRDLLAAARGEQVLAAHRVDRVAAGLHARHGGAEGLRSCVRPVLQAARRVDRVARAEGHVVERGRGIQRRAAPELVPQVRTARRGHAGVVPRRERGAGRATCRCRGRWPRSSADRRDRDRRARRTPWPAPRSLNSSAVSARGCSAPCA